MKCNFTHYYMVIRCKLGKFVAGLENKVRSRYIANIVKTIAPSTMFRVRTQHVSET